MFVSNCRRCPLPVNLTGFVLNVSKSCMLCPLVVTQWRWLRWLSWASEGGVCRLITVQGGWTWWRWLLWCDCKWW
ncbi:hypothetical protein Hanom_Chr15g01413311 [Helianthus anomalus]